jgi:hypothetical protein
LLGLTKDYSQLLLPVRTPLIPRCSEKEGTYPEDELPLLDDPPLPPDEEEPEEPDDPDDPDDPEEPEEPPFPPPPPPPFRFHSSFTSSKTAFSRSASLVTSWISVIGCGCANAGVLDSSSNATVHVLMENFMIPQ